MSSPDDDNILYELFVYAEWKPDPDCVLGEITGKTYSLQYANHLLSFLKPEQTLVDYLSDFNSYLQPWQICLGDNGKAIAILQDTFLEIRTKRGNFSSTVARAAVPKDPNPQWRRMAWSSDCSFLVLAHSNGKVSLYDLFAINLFNIPPDCVQPPENQCTDTTHAIAGMVFMTNRVVDQKWSSELLIVDYKGALRSYFISSTDGFKLYHTFNFDGGVSTFTYHNHHNMIFVSGLPLNIGQTNEKSSNYGLRGWRLLNDPPFYRLSTDEREPMLTYTSRMFYYIPLWKKPKQSVITKAVPSPNGNLLGCIHFDGSVTVWQLPALKLIKSWELISQPDFDTPSPLILNGNQKGWPSCKSDFSNFSPIDINWWNNEAFILSRINGSISICSLNDMHNKLIDKPVFLHGRPQVTNTFDSGFLSLECEATLISPKKLRRKSETDNETNTSMADISDVDIDDDDDEKPSLLSRTAEILKVPLYIITDMERFQPKPKKLNLLSRVYRLLSLKSTTPEELYLRKIENADYVEALNLADTYKLDSDLVYQQQWRSSKVSSQSIKDYLSKVSKKLWVIQQCCDRVPETIAAAKELLEFGMKFTKKEIYKGIKSSIDKKTFYENNDFDKITPEELSAQSTEILRYRYTMLFYLDRLEIYKAIIRSEICNYSSEEYNRLRSNSICRSAIEFAKEGRIEALVCLWPHLHDLSLQLLVLQNLPEVIDPNRYIALLPDIDAENTINNRDVVKRSMDWCEKEIFRFIWSSIGIDDIGLEDAVDGIIFTPPSTDLTEWYSIRAREIESLSGLAGHSLSLIKIAIAKHIPELENIHSLLLTLDILSYEINIEPITLSQLETSSHIEIANYLMSKTTHSTIIEDMKKLLLPYLERCEKFTSIPSLKNSLLKEYILNISKDDLTLVLVIFNGFTELGINAQQSLDLADYCFMGQDTNKNLSICFDILEALPESSDESITPSMLINTLDEMEKLLNACNLMENRNITITYSELKLLSGKIKELQDLLIKVSRSTTKTQFSANEWNNLLTDLLNLHSFLFSCIDNELCHEIFASALISSGNKPSIMSAEQVLTCQSGNGKNPLTESRTLMSMNKMKHPFKLNVTYKVSFDKSLSLVLQSAREYYNSSSSLNDPALEHAWTCLQLIKDVNVEIQLERDLISALRLLNDFDLSILPVQVRLYPSKIEFIEECLNCNEKAYKSIEKVLELARLLRVAGDDEKKREIIIVSLCAIKSIEVEDFEESKKLGKRLLKISDNAAAIHGVTAAQQLGSNPYILDLSLKHQLLNLALLHCEPQHIETLLQTRSSVESDILQSEINNLISMTNNLPTRPVNLQDSIESTEDDYLDALTSPLVENRIITTMQAVEKFIQKPLNVLGDKKSWKNALTFSWANEGNKSIGNETQSKNPGKLASHAFYSHMHNNCYTSILATQYDKFTTPDICDPQLVMLYSLTRNSLLLDCIKYGNSETTHTEAFIQCAEYTLMEDTAFSITQLLSVCNSEDFKRYIKSITLDIKTVSTFIYFYALAIYINTHSSADEGFFISPIELVNKVLKVDESMQNESNAYFFEGLQYCKNLMAQLIEGKKLFELGCNVNAELFAQDAAYRKSSILNLSKTENKDIFNLATELAKKYNVEEMELLYNHLTYIVINHKTIQNVDCNAVISDPILIEKLNQNTSDALERLNNSIWKIIDGKDHQGLLLYFNLINNINQRHMISGLNAKEHIKLIKKTKSACIELNYKYILTNPPQEDLFKNIIPILTRDNIGLVTKLLRNLPSNINIQLNTSNLYRDWLLKFFYAIPENQQSSKKWMQQHRECSSYFSKLNTYDLLLFTTDILFSASALDKLPPSTRIQIAFQTADYCQHEHHNAESMNFHSKHDDGNSWENTGSTIIKWGKFLENFHSEHAKQVIQISHEITSDSWRNIEITRGEISSLLKPLSDLIMNNDFSVKSLAILLETLNVDISINDVLLYIMENIEFNEITLSKITKSLVELKIEGYIIDNNVLDRMKPFTTSGLLSSKQRLDLMSLYKVHSNFDDTEMLEKISIEMICHIWGDRILDDCDDINIREPLCRRDVFIKLIDKDVNWTKLKALVDLMNMWPVQIHEECKRDMPNIRLIIRLLNDENLEENIPLFKLLLSKQNITYEDVSWIINNKILKNPFAKLWLCLLSSDNNVHETILPKVAIEIQDENQIDEHLNENLLADIIRRQLFTTFVRTKIYIDLVQFLFKNGLYDDNENLYNYSIQKAIRELLQKKFFAEAGALKLSALGVPQALKTFTQSLSN